MRLAIIASIGSYNAADIERKVEHFKTVLHPDTEVEMFTAPSGVPYVESGIELHLTAVAVARLVVAVADRGFDAIVGTAFLATLCSTIAGIGSVKAFQRLPFFASYISLPFTHTNSTPLRGSIGLPVTTTRSASLPTSRLPTR